ncbi:MAG: hypothetical protein ACRDZ7_08940 [Acidimicrobiia bacterium]
MTITTANERTATVVLPAGGPARSWADVAARAHAILTQTLPDELLDEIMRGHQALRPRLELRPVLAG